ncbi:phage portal protein [Oceanobacillus massiliensis]|uniref:phage portal protein n=1 Tax=Oceanobacillus massiliensis TaxID=1465765 RepID=UPI00028846AA|nr:phage portal protein [Oceanobacillus massiliensis]
MELQEYIGNRYDGQFKKFILDEVNNVSQQSHIREITSIKEYLGKNQHKVNTRPNETFNGKEVEVERVTLNYAKTIIHFGVNFLLGKNPVQLSGKENVVKELNRTYKKGKYHKIDYKILNDLIRYGETFEYVYVKDGKIFSQIIDPSEAFPVYDPETNEMLAFIQYYHSDYTDFYVVFTEDIVYKYNNSQGEDIQLVNQRPNNTGLPIHYKTENESDSTRGYSELNDYIEIIDSMEHLLSKAVDGYYRHIMGTPVIIGQNLTNADIPKHGNGIGLRLDDDGDFKYVTNPFSHQAFKELYGTLKNALGDISSMPNVLLNGGSTISNVGDVAIESIFYLSLIKANLNSKYLQDGFEVRLDKIRSVLDMQGIVFDDDDYEATQFVFSPNMPKDDKQLVEIIDKLKGIGAISTETILDNVSFIDKVSEMERLANEGVNGEVNED